MKTDRAIAKFAELGLVLRKDPDGRTWVLASETDPRDVERFQSLQACRKWWDRQLLHVALEYDAIERALRLATINEDLLTQVRSWAQSGGLIDLPDRLLCEIYYTSITFGQSEPTWQRPCCPALASRAWEFRRTDQYATILQALIDRDAADIQLATREAKAASAPLRRL